MMERRTEDAEYAEAENNSKEDKIQPGEEGNMDETGKDAEKGLLPTVIPAEKDPSKVEEEGKRGEEGSKSKCSKLQSLVFGSLQKFFMAQVRNKTITVWCV